MAKYLSIVLLCLVSMGAQADGLVMSVSRVHDGDTISVTTTALPSPLSKMSVRLLGVDTPELLGKCPAEIAKAKEARAFTTKFIGAAREITVTGYKWDKYGGRIDGAVAVGGQDLSTALISAGLARPYTGGVKASWCN